MGPDLQRQIAVTIHLKHEQKPHIKYQFLNMLKIKIVDFHILSNRNNLHSLEVVDRVSETQLQVSENSVKGLTLEENSI